VGENFLTSWTSGFHRSLYWSFKKLGGGGKKKKRSRLFSEALGLFCYCEKEVEGKRSINRLKLVPANKQ